MILGALASSKDAAADPEPPCRVRLAGGGASATWASARNRVEDRVAILTAASTDCRLIVVTPEAQGASVEFTTADRRIARRHIGGPDDLLPLVEALLVFGHDPMAIAPPPPPAAETVLAIPEAPTSAEEIASDESAQTSPIPTALAAPASKDKVGGARPDAPRVLLGAGAGVKNSWPNDSLTGVGQVFVGMTLTRWEVAAFGRLELEHDADDDANQAVTTTVGRLRYSAIGGGAMFGRREHVGPLVLVGGARAAVYDAEVERVAPKTPTRPTPRRDEFLDPRVGLYAGVVATESSRLRVRVQVDGDMGVVVHRAELADLGAFPRWNLGISLGAETGFLP